MGISFVLCRAKERSNVATHPSSSCDAYCIISASSEQLDNPCGKTASVLQRRQHPDLTWCSRSKKEFPITLNNDSGKMIQDDIPDIMKRFDFTGTSK